MKVWLKGRLPVRLWDNLATISILAALGVLALGFYKIVELGEQGREAHAAICTFRADLAQRVNASREFLQDHPRGIPGISASVIRNGIINQQKTVDALRNLKCKERL